jgi:hypothetical protein
MGHISELSLAQSYAQVYRFIESKRDYCIRKDLEEKREQWIKLPLDDENPFFQRLRDNYLQAQQYGLVTLQGRQSLANNATETLSMAVQTVLNFGPLPRPGVSSGNGLEEIQPFENSGIKSAYDYMISWLESEGDYQIRKYGPIHTDKNILKPLDFDNPWWEEFADRYKRAQILGLDNINGRQTVGKIAALSIATTAAAIRNFGLLD